MCRRFWQSRQDVAHPEPKSVTPLRPIDVATTRTRAPGLRRTTEAFFFNMPQRPKTTPDRALGALAQPRRPRHGLEHKRQDRI